MIHSIRKIICIVIAALSYLDLHAQKIPDQKPNIITNGKAQGDWVIWYTSKFEKTDIIDSVAYYRKISFRDGKPVGLVTDYYRSGKPQWQANLISFEPDTPDGRAIWYFESGNKSSELKYFNGVIQGECITYFESGKVEMRLNYKDGLYDGDVTEYYKNGHLQLKGKFKAGKKEGHWITYYENGKKSKENNYIDGQLQGEELEYYESEKLEIRSNYLDNEYDGEIRSYFEDGKVDAMGQYSKGERVGKWYWYRNDGGLNSERDYSLVSIEEKWKAIIAMVDSFKKEERYMEAIKLAEKAYRFELDSLGKDHKYYSFSMDALAFLYEIVNEYEKALPMLTESMNFTERKYGKTHKDYGTSLNNLGALYERMGRYDKALPLYQESLEHTIKNSGKDSADYGIRLKALAGLYHSMGQFDKSLKLYFEALPVLEKTIGKEDEIYGVCLNNFSSLYSDMGQFEKAEPLMMEALSITEKLQGKNHSDYGYRLTNLAILYRRMEQYDKALPLFLEAKDNLERTLGKNNSFYGMCISGLAGVYLSQSQFEKALPLYLESLSNTEKSLGKEHPDYGIRLNNLGVLYERMGQRQKAQEYMVESMNSIARSLGKEHSEYAIRLNNLAGLYWKMGRLDDAMPLYKEAFSIILKNMMTSFSCLPENEKAEYANKVIYNFEIYNSFFLKYYSSRSTLASDAFNIELAAKGMILNSGVEMRQSILNSGNPIALKTYDEWNILKAELAKQYSLPVTKRREDIKDAEEQANRLEGELTRLSSTFKQGKSLLGIEWKDIQNKLQANEVAIEFTSFTNYDVRRWADSVFYIALVLRKEDAYPSLVYLCEARQLDSLLKKEGTTDAGFVSSLYRGSELLEQASSFSYGQRLYELIWKPMEDLLHRGDKIFFAPSGLLHQIAFAAIPYRKDSLLSDRYRLNQLSSTAMLLRESAFKQSQPESMAVFGGIQYDATAKDILNNIPKDTASTQFVSREVSSDASRGGMSYLPGTLTEAKAIEGIAASKKVKVSSYYGLSALEERYKKIGLAKSPRVIHIATHGFFFPDPKVEKKENAGNDDKQAFKYSDNPLNRSGLLFAGANNAWAGNAIPGIEDGILTAYEAANVSLSNTQLVVLSACETGLGDIKGSEGVFGLQRAFKMAGAEYLMMSLWKVPDAETSEFMQYFYASWFSGKSINNAFIDTQNRMKTKYPKEPYKWAAFVLVR